jgi:hypothetical protein
MPDSLLRRSRLRIRYYKRGVPWYGVVLRILIDTVSKLGLRIEPYHLFLEGLGNLRAPIVPAARDGYEIGFLDASDMREVARMPGRNLSEEDLLCRLQNGLRCLGVKHSGAIVAFTWCNLDECAIEKHRLFSLRADEASLFDAYTIESFRGRDLAPYMRYRCYEELAKLGRHRCYSVSVVFNTPAVRFKRKLGAQVLELGVFVEVLGRWRFHARLNRNPVQATQVAAPAQRTPAEQ